MIGLKLGQYFMRNEDAKTGRGKRNCSASPDEGYVYYVMVIPLKAFDLYICHFLSTPLS